MLQRYHGAVSIPRSPHGCPHRLVSPAWVRSLDLKPVLRPLNVTGPPQLQPVSCCREADGNA